MLDIILNILLVLLIIVGVLVGILLLALGIVLFVPVRYSSQGSYDEKFKCTFSVTWILKIFQFLGSYDEDGFKWTIKLFYRDYKTQDDLKAFLEDKPEEKDKPPEKTDKPSEEKDKPSEQTGKPPDETPSPPMKPSEEETDKKIYEEKSVRKTPAEKPKKKTIKEKIAELKAKIRDIKIKASDIWTKVKNILLKVDDFVQFAKQEKVKKEFRTIGRQLLKVLNHIKPKILKGRLLIGTGEPDKTGMVIGAMCILYGIYGEDFTVTADFENKVINGEYFVKGHFNLFLFVWVFIRILCQKNLMVYIFNLIKNEFLSNK